MSFEEMEKRVIDKDLCSRCGTCAGGCPAENIEFADISGKCYPVSRGRCIKGCSICNEICPGGEIDLSSMVAGLGHYSDISLVRAADKSIREGGTSGGAITAMLVASLEKKRIDGVLMVGYDPLNPSGTIPKIIYDPKEIVDNTQSRYSVVPLNQLLTRLEKHKKYAVVALPCMLAGLDKLGRKNKIINEQIVLKLGLFCHSTMYYEATCKLLACAGLNNTGEVSRIRYREGGFPGGFVVHADNKKTDPIKLQDFMVLFNYHSLNRCRLCIDHNAAMADLAFADPFPFLDELPADDQKWTAVVARTSKGKEWLLDMLEDQTYIVRKEVTANNIQTWDTKLRGILRIHLNQLSMNKTLRMPIPDYHYPLPALNLFKGLFNLVRVHIFKDIMLSAGDILKRIWRMEITDKKYRIYQKKIILKLNGFSKII